jgi:hypothetical protein
VEAARPAIAALVAAADRLDALAEVAELMGDDDGAVRFRAEGSRCREQAMLLLDPERPTP